MGKKLEEAQEELNDTQSPELEKEIEVVEEEILENGVEVEEAEKKEEEKEPGIKRYKQHISMKYIFSKSEKEEITEKLLEEIDATEALEAEKKAAMDAFKSQIGQSEATVKNLRTKRSNGYEYRSVQADVVLDKYEGTRDFYHPVTGTFIKTENIPAIERQLSIEDDF